LIEQDGGVAELDVMLLEKYAANNHMLFHFFHVPQEKLVWCSDT
jgi:hypothetical protein